MSTMSGLCRYCDGDFDPKDVVVISSGRAMHDTCATEVAKGREGEAVRQANEAARKKVEAHYLALGQASEEAARREGRRMTDF